MPTSVPVPDKAAGDVLTETNWDAHIRDNINKLLDRGHRVLTVAQFSALTGLEDGDEVYLEVDAANGVVWHLRYVAAETTYRWRYLGGPPLLSEVTTSESTTSTAYAALATAGPSVALPRSGDYDVDLGGALDSTNEANGIYMSYDIGGTGAVDADRVGFDSGRVDGANLSRRRRKTALGSVTLTSKYKAIGGAVSCSAKDRVMHVRPVRIRHDV